MEERDKETKGKMRPTKRMQATARRLSVVSATSCARRRLIRDVDSQETESCAMKVFAKRLAKIAAILAVCFIGVVYACYGCPSLWVKDFEVDPALNADLASRSFASAEEAAYEVVFWQVPSTERVAFAKIEPTVRSTTGGALVAILDEPCKDDSYSVVHHELTLQLVDGRYSVTRHRKCWMGRNLIGWSTKIPS
jgi:hypothetical protein